MRFSRPNRKLQATFPPSEQGVYPQPVEVTDTVSLVHPYPGREWENIVTSQLASASVVTPSLVALAPAGPGTENPEWNEVIYADVSHNSVSTRVLQLRLFNPVLGFNTFIARWVNIVSAVTPGQPGGFEPVFGHGHLVSAGAAISSEIVRPPHPLVIPPGYQLILDGDTAGVAYQVSLSVVFARHFLADQPIAF